jgi:hypothetical protein
MHWRSASESIRIVASRPQPLNVRIGLGPGDRNCSTIPSLSLIASEAPFVSETSDNRAIANSTHHSSPALNPFKSPTYPQRIHFQEREALQESLRSCEERIQAIRQKLDTLGSHPQRESYEQIYHQMLGARDQIAETVRRLPMETGSLYDEDKERYVEAVAACERAYGRWEAIGR